MLHSSFIALPPRYFNTYFYYVLAIRRFTSVSPLDGNMNFPTERLASLFPAKSDTKHGPNPALAASPRLPIREKLHPFLATIPPSAARPLAVADFQFSSPRTNCLRHWLLGALKHSRRLLSLSLSLTATLPVIPPWYFSPPLTVTL